MEVKTVNFPRTRVAVLEHRGTPERINASVATFIEWRKASGLSPVKSSQTYGVTHSNPDTTAAEDFRFDICGSVTAEVPDNQYGIINKEIPAGRCAVVRHMGSHDEIKAPIYYLYREWLPASGEELREFPLYFQYINLIPEVPEHELITDIFLPLK